MEIATAASASLETALVRVAIGRGWLVCIAQRCRTVWAKLKQLNFWVAFSSSESFDGRATLGGAPARPTVPANTAAVTAMIVE
jgi:hypothetical protein